VYLLTSTVRSSTRKGLAAVKKHLSAIQSTRPTRNETLRHSNFIYLRILPHGPFDVSFFWCFFIETFSISLIFFVSSTRLISTLLFDTCHSRYSTRTSLHFVGPSVSSHLGSSDRRIEISRGFFVRTSQIPRCHPFIPTRSSPGT
jgi:hypothetical protein